MESNIYNLYLWFIQYKEIKIVFVIYVPEQRGITLVYFYLNYIKKKYRAIVVIYASVTKGLNSPYI